MRERKRQVEQRDEFSKGRLNEWLTCTSEKIGWKKFWIGKKKRHCNFNCIQDGSN
jgi:hypothetical protein